MESFYILTAREKDHKKPTEGAEDKVVAITIEDEEEEGLMDELTGHKGEMHHGLFALGVIKPVTMSTTVQTGYLNFKKHRRLRMIVHTRLRS